MNLRVSATCFVRQAALRSSSIANPSDARKHRRTSQQNSFSRRFPQTPVAITAPVSHQKRSQRDATNTIKLDQIVRKINAGAPCPAAHNGLVGGSSPPGPTSFPAAPGEYERFVGYSSAKKPATENLMVCSSASRMSIFALVELKKSSTRPPREIAI
jgi:hypothetical protein